MSTSRIIVELCPLIDGTRDLDSLIAAAAPGLTPAEVIYATQQLERAGVIEARPDRASPEQIPRSVTLAERAGEHWTIAATDAAAAAIMVDALASVRFEQVGERRHLVVVRDYLEPAAGQLMTELSNRGEAWLPIKLRGERAYFGPSFGHGRKACWLCVRARLEANRPVEAFLKREIGRPFGFAHETDAQIGPQGKALAGIVAEHLADERLDDGILEWDGPAGQLRRHAIVACSDCPHCGRLSRCVGALEAPPNLARDIPISRRSGGYRVREAAETVASLAPIISDLTGFIASVGPIVIAPPETGSATEQHHARHVHAAAYLRTPRTTRPMVDDFHGVSLGKGRDAEQAQASAVCEAIERLSAHYRDGVRVKIASIEELGEDAIAPNAIWQFSATQYATREAWNAATSDTRRHVPPILAPNQKIAWVRAYSLEKQNWRWLPRDHCYANTPEPRYGRFNPNGHAAGTCFEEALLQGFLELVERDSVAIWWYNRLCRPGCDPNVAANSHVRALAAGLVAQGWRSWLLDLTTDLGIPCFAALARAEADGRWCIGFGCHFETGIAVERAMTELIQLFRADGRDGPPPWTPMEDGNEEFLFPAQTHSPEAVRPKDAPISHIGTLAGLIEWACDRVADHGMEMLVLDQTHPDLKLPVAKVIVPGLRHFWPRFGPGRLYDVPVTMGWRPPPIGEAHLNSSHLFL